ncbi:MAG: NYN domain-containing protein [Chloroflexota bacterium]|nr:NYN domain-containing protein [Chloroflexota bacterium]
MAFPIDRIFSAPDPIDPHLRRWMLFVDGENVTLRGQALAESRGIVLEPGPRFKRDVFLWLEHPWPARAALSHELRGIGVRGTAERAFYYTSMSGDDDAITDVRESLWALGFTGEVFKKQRKDIKAKGVDIALTKDLLSNAFLDNFDVAVVMTGDADYRPVIAELKRLGKMVCLMTFTEGGAKVNRELKLSADFFIPVDDVFMHFRRRPQEAAGLSTSDHSGSTDERRRDG